MQYSYYNRLSDIFLQKGKTKAKRHIANTIVLNHQLEH
jgi:hypothetical protein